MDAVLLVEGAISAGWDRGVLPWLHPHQRGLNQEAGVSFGSHFVRVVMMLRDLNQPMGEGEVLSRLEANG